MIISRLHLTEMIYLRTVFHLQCSSGLLCFFSRTQGNTRFLTNRNALDKGAELYNNQYLLKPIQLRMDNSQQ